MKGGGGQCGRRGNKSLPDRLTGEGLAVSDAAPILFRVSPAIGVLVGHASNKGTSGVTLDLNGSREKMRARGIRGRLMKLCQGQLDGSSVRRRSNILIVAGQRDEQTGTRSAHSVPRNSRMAYAPYAVLSI